MIWKRTSAIRKIRKRFKIKVLKPSHGDDLILVLDSRKKDTRFFDTTRQVIDHVNSEMNGIFSDISRQQRNIDKDKRVMYYKYISS